MPESPVVRDLILSSDPADTRTLDELAVEWGVELTDRDRRDGPRSLARHRARSA